MHNIRIAAVRRAASEDPVGFLARESGPVIIDEVQRVPDLLLAIKRSVDKTNRPGQYLLTGSASLQARSAVADALVGRLEQVPLWPLSQGEIEGCWGCLIDALFADQALSIANKKSGAALFASRAVRGGFPEAVGRRSAEDRIPWFADYLDGALKRDLLDLSQIRAIDELMALLALIATRVGGIVNYAAMSRELGIALNTVRKYVALLEAVYLIKRIPSWRVNLGHRLIKAPKIHIADSGLHCYLLGIDESAILAGDRSNGAVLEGFVAMELIKHLSWSEVGAALYHYRSASGLEVDFVLESRNRGVVGIEVKAAATVGAGDFKGLRVLRDQLGEKFIAGLVLYCGDQTLPFGERLSAMPVNALWA